MLLHYLNIDFANILHCEKIITLKFIIHYNDVWFLVSDTIFQEFGFQNSNEFLDRIDSNKILQWQQQHKRRRKQQFFHISVLKELIKQSPKNAIDCDFEYIIEKFYYNFSNFMFGQINKYNNFFCVFPKHLQT